MSATFARQKGFTIVELLIVIVVIAVLATISVVAYNGVQDRARQAKISSDIGTIIKAVSAARHSASKNMKDITGTTYTASACVAKPDGTDLAALPDTDTCISRYKTTLDTISVASGIKLGDIRDPWGRPYMIDENESETNPTNCLKDTVAVFKQPFTTGFGSYSTTPTNNVPLGGFTGC